MPSNGHEVLLPPQIDLLREGLYFASPRARCRAPPATPPIGGGPGASPYGFGWRFIFGRRLAQKRRDRLFSWLAAFRVCSLCRNRPRSPLTHLFLSLLWCLPPLLKVPLTPSRPAAPPARRLPATSNIAHLTPSTTTYRPPPPRASPTPTTTTRHDLPGSAARHDLLVLPLV